MNTGSKESNSKLLEKNLIIIGIIALVFIITIFVFYFSNFNGSLSLKQEQWGTFGDFIGGVLNPILSFFALMALLYTIFLQNRELEATREELQRSADAQENSRKALDKQSEILRRQQFEQTFFALLEEHNSALNGIKTERYNRNSENTILETVWEDVFNSSNKFDDSVSLDIAKKQLGYKNDVCGHYFRILYQLLKFIAVNIEDSQVGLGFDKEKLKNSSLVDNEKMYSNIVRSFLDHKTLQILAINCACENSEDPYWGYRLLIERYEFLEHMPIGGLTALKGADSLYNKSVFGRRVLIET